MRAAIILLAFVMLAACGGSFDVVADLKEPHGTIVVANMSDDTVMLVDGITGKVERVVPSGPAPHEVAVSADGRWAVVTNYGDSNRRGNTLTVIDIAGETGTSMIDLGIYDRPHGIVFVDGREDVVAISSETNQAVVFVEIASGEILDTVSTGQRASHMVARGSSDPKLYTTNIVDGSISRIDPATGERTHIFPVGTMVEGIAVSPSGQQVWVGANRDGKVIVVETADGTVAGSVDGFGFPYRMAFTSDGLNAIVSDPQSGTVKIINPVTMQVRNTVTFDRSKILPTAEIPGSPSPEGLVVDEHDRYVYVSMQGMNKVAAVEIASGTVVRYYDVGQWPDGIGYSPLRPN